jgi:hypothetical protein
MLTEGFRNLGLAVTPGESLFGWLAQRAAASRFSCGIII